MKGTNHFNEFSTTLCQMIHTGLSNRWLTTLSIKKKVKNDFEFHQRVIKIYQKWKIFFSGQYFSFELQYYWVDHRFQFCQGCLERKLKKVRILALEVEGLHAFLMIFDVLMSKGLPNANEPRQPIEIQKNLCYFSSIFLKIHLEHGSRIFRLMQVRQPCKFA